ncbi:unnamed protein product [Diamesa serratosioi]
MYYNGHLPTESPESSTNSDLQSSSLSMQEQKKKCDDWSPQQQPPQHETANGAPSSKSNYFSTRQPSSGYNCSSG